MTGNLIALESLLSTLRTQPFEDEREEAVKLAGKRGSAELEEPALQSTSSPAHRRRTAAPRTCTSRPSARTSPASCGT